MKVYIANFGRENYEWPTCLERSTVATMIHRDTKSFYDAGDHKGFVNWSIANAKAASGLTPTPSLAKRWYNAMETIEHTEGDIWIHRADDKLWWTTSRNTKASWEVQRSKMSKDQIKNDKILYVCHKPCDPWSNKNRKGNPLYWNALNPKAQDFLRTQSTLQKLSDDNAEYAIALINGDDLSPWESQTDWKAKVEITKRSSGEIYSPWQKTLWSIVNTVKNTVKNANGQTVERIVKNKEMRFTEDELKSYIEALRESQEGLCAITGIQLEFEGEADDTEMIYSLDRIDSNGHYEAGNLQLVCRFINRWKSDSDDTEFRRLIAVLKESV